MSRPLVAGVSKWVSGSHTFDHTTARFLQPTSHHYSTRTSRPLHILFCGSDEFSIASLRALHREHQQNPQLVQSINVLCRPGKRVGRFLKQIREVPIKAVATELGLPVYERDTFRGWELPRPGNEAINLIIAVSFGLFVPARLLRSAEYGGLNVHPSLLPQFRGPAPIQHTIMNGFEKTGVTLQTLDEKSFDHGTILAQTPGDGVLLPQNAECTYAVLLDLVSALGAQMLVDGLRKGLHVPPLQQVGRTVTNEEQDAMIHATKLTSQDRQIPLGSNAAQIAVRLERALGRLWCNIWVDGRTQKRMSCEGLKVEALRESIEQQLRASRIQNDAGSDRVFGGECGTNNSMACLPLYFVVVAREDGKRRAILYYEEGNNVVLILGDQCLKIHSVVIEGQSKTTAAKAMRSIRSSGVWTLRHDTLINSKEELSMILAEGLHVEELQKYATKAQ